MEAEGDYITINKNNLIAKSGIATQTGLMSFRIVQNSRVINFRRMKPEDAFGW